VGNFQTVMVAMYFSSGVNGSEPVGPGSGVEDLALLQLELGVVQDAGVVQLAELPQLGELGVGVGPRRTRIGVLRLRGGRGLLVGPSVPLSP
jgi:hypothetical protein